MAASKSSISQLNDIILGSFSHVQPSETLDHLVRFLRTCSGSDTIFMVMQYAVNLIATIFNLRARLKHRAGFRPAPTSGAAEGYAKFGSTLRNSRTMWRIWGLLLIFKWLISLERSTQQTRNLLTIERLQGWSMIAYYPLEHLSYLGGHGIIPTSITLASIPFLSSSSSTRKPRTLNLDPNTLGIWSCRFWAIYVLLHFAHLREDWKLLHSRQGSLKKAKGAAGLTLIETQQLKEQWEAYWTEVIINLGCLPLTIHGSLRKGLFKNEVWAGLFGLIAALASFRGGWKATALLPAHTPSPVADNKANGTHIPTEIVETIIDHLQHDRTSLKTVSLVSHAWLVRSRHHLFYNDNLNFRNESRVFTFLELVASPTATIATANVRRLGFELTLPDASLFNLFPLVTHMYIRNCSFAINRTPGNYTNGFPRTTTHLYLNLTSFESLEVFAKILDSLPRLSYLSLIDVSWYVGYRTPLVIPPTLRTLRLDPTGLDFAESFASKDINPTSPIRTLSILPLDHPPALLENKVQPVLHIMGSSLETFVFEFIKDSIDLSMAANLKRLHALLFLPFFSVFKQSLSSIPPNTLEGLHIGLFERQGYRDLEYVNWYDFRSTLDGPSFASLRKVCFYAVRGQEGRVRDDVLPAFEGAKYDVGLSEGPFKMWARGALQRSEE